MMLLKSAYDKVQNSGWVLVNLDCVVICETPKILPRRDAIRASLAASLNTGIENIFVKGKTNEGLESTGTGEAVEALAVCLLQKKDHKD